MSPAIPRGAWLEKGDELIKVAIDRKGVGCDGTQLFLSKDDLTGSAAATGLGQAWGWSLKFPVRRAVSYDADPADANRIIAHREEAFTTFQHSVPLNLNLFGALSLDPSWGQKNPEIRLAIYKDGTYDLACRPTRDVGGLTQGRCFTPSGEGFTQPPPQN